MAWHRFVLEELIPGLTDRGFNVLFLDTMDSALALERAYPERYQGSTEGLVSLIKKIKNKYPHLKLISNNAFSILPKIDNLIEYVVAESLFTSYDFTSKKYRLARNDDTRSSSFFRLTTLA